MPIVYDNTVLQHRTYPANPAGGVDYCSRCIVFDTVVYNSSYTIIIIQIGPYNNQK